MLQRLTRLTTTQLFLLALASYLFFAYFNYGHNTGDEYSQIYEFAAYKLGWINHSDLRLWEYNNQMRPSLQIWLVYWLYKLLAASGQPVNVFILNYIIQAGSALLTIACCAYSVQLLSSQLQPEYRRIFVFLSLFTWLGIYTGLHFNSENIAGKIYFLALLLLLDNDKQRRLYKLVAAGLVFGVAFACRFQVAFSAIGVVVWLLSQRKLTLSQWLVLLINSLLSIGIFNIWIDHWFYGGWPLTAYNYYYQNIVTGTMNSYGTDPFYTYIPMLLGYLPWGPIYLIASIWFCFKNPRHIFTFAIVPFFIIHCLIGHKEIRFLLPLIALMPFCISYWLQGINFLTKIANNSGWNKLTRAILWLNAIAFLTLLVPAATEIGGWKYIYYNYPTTTTIFYNASKDRKLLFYIRPTTQLISVESATAIHCPPSGNCLYLLDADKTESMIPGKLVYSFFPLWATRYNYANWMKNIGHFNIYQIQPANDPR